MTLALILDAIHAIFRRARKQDEAARHDAAMASRSREHAARSRTAADSRELAGEVLDEWGAPRKMRTQDPSVMCCCGTSDGQHRDWCRAKA